MVTPNCCCSSLSLPASRPVRRLSVMASTASAWGSDRLNLLARAALAAALSGAARMACAHGRQVAEKCIRQRLQGLLMQVCGCTNCKLQRLPEVVWCVLRLVQRTGSLLAAGVILAAGAMNLCKLVKCVVKAQLPCAHAVLKQAIACLRCCSRHALPIQFMKDVKLLSAGGVASLLWKTQDIARQL